MDQLRSWLYGHDSSIQSRQRHTTHGSSDDPGVQDKKHAQQKEQLASDVSGWNNLQHSDSSLRHAILKVIPLAPGDCLECKLVGTGVMMLSGIIVLTSAVASKTRNPNYVGMRRAIYYTVCGGLFVGFEATALCRLFDWGPFRKTDNISFTEKLDKS